MDNNDKIISNFRENILNRFDENNTFLDLFNLKGINKELVQKVWSKSKEEFKGFIDNFYKYIIDTQDIRPFLKDIDIPSLKKRQFEYFDELLKMDYNDEFLKKRINLGITHQSIHLPIHFYLGASKHFLDFIQNIGITILKNNQQDLLEYNNSINKIFMMDITLVIEGYLGTSQGKIESQKEELSKFSHEKSEFSKIFIHDVKNPLNLVYNYALFLKTAVINNDIEKIKKFADKIITPLERSFKIIDEYFVVNNLEDTLLDSQKIKCDLISLINDVIELNLPLAESRNIKIEFSPPPTKIILVLIQEAINYALSNLINNAIKFSPEDTLIKIEIEELNNTFSIKIKDQGIGILESELENLFNPNRKKVNKPLDNSYSSGGWGLYYTKKILEAHQGSIEIQSEPKKGTLVILTLPK